MTLVRLARAGLSTVALFAVALGSVAAAPLDPVGQAESVVAAAPRDAAARFTLGQAYLSAGRLLSARTSFADTLTLAPDDARAALKLALVDVALGNNDQALDTLAQFGERIEVGDLGLARVLAGDVAGGTALLEVAARGKKVQPKVRQNLALAYALAGRWLDARTTARQDLNAAEADARLLQWMQFARPRNSYDQVAQLLSITPVDDGGQPERLALRDAPGQVAEAAPATAVEPEPVPQRIVQAVEVQQSDAAVAPQIGQPVFAAAREVVQPLPLGARSVTVSLPKARPVPHPQPAARVRTGSFVVQLGAYGNERIAEAAWRRGSARLQLSGFAPASARTVKNGVPLVRLSVGPFGGRTEAVQLCSRIQGAGGSCFVRPVAGDRVASWANRDAQFAAR